MPFPRIFSMSGKLRQPQAALCGNCSALARKELNWRFGDVLVTETIMAYAWHTVVIFQSAEQTKPASLARPLSLPKASFGFVAGLCARVRQRNRVATLVARADKEEHAVGHVNLIVLESSKCRNLRTSRLQWMWRSCPTKA